MEAGARVWISDTDGDDAWILCEVISRTATNLNVQTIASPPKKFTRPRVQASRSDEAIELKYEGVELANTPLSDAEKAEGKDSDMITLPHLHEPAILHAIGDRFDRGEIYTWTGPVLIAVNPFQRLPLYTNVSCHNNSLNMKFSSFPIQSGHSLRLF
jgi:myosin heavy subunit